MEIEYTDHNLNKNIYYFAGDAIVKEFQTIIDAYSGGEVFYVDHLLLCIIFNDFKIIIIYVTKVKHLIMTSNLKLMLKLRLVFIGNISI